MIVSILSWLLFSNAHAGLVSIMPSTFTEVSVPNSHLVSPNVIRGMAPRNEADIDSLIAVGVSDVLIFKNETSGEVTKEINLLEEKGIEKTKITHIDFPWKDISDFRPVCEMTIAALNKLESAENNNRKIFFHCTVGEDRTGYLAGLYKIYRGDQNIQEVFQGELCDKGYEAGDPKKGMNVVLKVRESLTPAFLKMIDVLNLAKKNKAKLNKKLCDQVGQASLSSVDISHFKCD